jgi:hypothetical protein
MLSPKSSTIVLKEDNLKSPIRWPSKSAKFTDSIKKSLLTFQLRLNSHHNVKS